MEQLRTYREQAGMSAYAMAKALGMSDNGYRRLEAGGTPNHSTLIDIANLLAKHLSDSPANVLVNLTGVSKKKAASTKAA